MRLHLYAKFSQGWRLERLGEEAQEKVKEEEIWQKPEDNEIRETKRNAERKGGCGVNVLANQLLLS